MGFFDRVVAKPVRDLFVASPPEGYALIHRHPDQSIPSRAKVTVRSDEVALFFKEGRLVGILEAGTYMLETANIPFLGNLIVTPLTGGNHFIAELFFVRTNDIPHTAQAHKLGSFTDVGSRHVVSLEYRANIVLRVTDAARLVTTLAGQRTSATESLGTLVDARLQGILASVVGRLASAEPILQIASNQFSDDLGAHVIARANEVFAPHGLSLVQCLGLELALDPSSEQLLRSHGQQLAQLTLDREAAQLAEQPGYATMHLVQGQRALLEGMGVGASHGGGGFAGAGLAMALGGAGLIGNGYAAPRPVAPAAAPARLGPAAPDARYYLRGARGVEGPYTPRQLALRAKANGLDITTTLVRPESGGDWLDASAVPEVECELGRRDGRALAPAAGVGANVGMFEQSFEMAVADGNVTEDELAILSSLCQAVGLAGDTAAARAYVLRRAKALGCGSPAI